MYPSAIALPTLCSLRWVWNSVFLPHGPTSKETTTFHWSQCWGPTWWVHFPSQHDGYIPHHNTMGTFPVTTWWVHFPMGTFPISGLIVTPLLVCVSSLSNGHWQLQAFFTQLSFVLVKIYSSDNQSLIDLCQEHNLVKWISLDLHWIAKMTRHQTIRWHWRCQGITP